MLHWFWIPLAVLSLLTLYQQFRIYRIRRESQKNEELFQIVTENAADMIALVDVKGRRLYNSPAYKKILGYSAAELGETSAFEQIHPRGPVPRPRSSQRSPRNRPGPTARVQDQAQGRHLASPRIDCQYDSQR